METREQDFAEERHPKDVLSYETLVKRTLDIVMAVRNGDAAGFCDDSLAVSFRAEQRHLIRNLLCLLRQGAQVKVTQDPRIVSSK